jgi:PAS domain S-box-containing protein
VDSTTTLNTHQDICQCSEAIAHEWYFAFASIGSFQLDRTEALEKFSQLTDQVMAFLTAENPEKNAAREIGEALASLPCIDPLAIEISGKLWAGHLVEDVSPAAPAWLYARMLALFNGMSAGFFRRARELVLEDQEAIRSAMAADLLRTTLELRKYQSQLEVLLSERTQELRESEEKFRVIAETSIDGIFQSTDEPVPATLIYVNDAFAQMLGYTKEELLGRSTLSLLAEEWMPKLNPVAENLRANRPAHGEFQMRHQDGHLIDVRFNNVPTMLKGRVVRSGILQDITERKRVQVALFQSEERYRTLAEASPDMIYIFDKDQQFQYVNSKAAAFFNLPSEEIIGQPRGSFFSPSTSARHRKNIQKVLKNGKSLYNEIETGINGRTIWISTWLVPLRDASGNISAVMGVSRDITVQKKAEKEILRSRDLLEKRVAERTAELTTSQNQLRKLTDQLVTILEEERRRISRELHDEASQALISLKYGIASFQNDIPASNIPARQRLVYAMNTADQVMQQIRMITHGLRPPVLEILGIHLSLKDYCEEFTKRTGLTIHYQGEEVPGLPDEIGISLYRFVQEAFTNILKHAGATQVEVRLQYRKKRITLSISDNGCGMEDANHSEGIGLIGIKERLNLVGGELIIRSRKGQGVNTTASVPWPRPVGEIKQ